MFRRLIAALTMIVAVLAALDTTAWAHNSLVGATPPDGATVQPAPTQMSFVFTAAVPLDTFSADLIDASGSRTSLSGFVHGPGGDTEVVVPLPSLAAGSVSVRWRLVGPDGHVITARIGFTVVADAAATPTQSAGTAPTPSAPAVSAPALDPDMGDGTWTTPDSARWALRFVSYLAIMVILGVLGVAAFIWSRAATHPLMDQIVHVAIATAFLAGAAQLLVIASDISGRSPLSSLSSVDNALSTDAGKAYALRLVTLIALAACLYVVAWADETTMQASCLALIVVLLATWAYAGHSKSMRAAVIGVPIDVAHHGAAGLWLGGLIVVGGVVMREAPPAEAAEAVRRFAALAAPAVAVVAVTGLVQTIRLVGSPLNILDARHGRYLLVKLAILGVMLWIADKNRRAVATRFSGARPIGTGSMMAMRRAIGTEFAVGLGIIAVTAAMVVSPPATALAAQASAELAQPNQPNVSTAESPAVTQLASPTTALPPPTTTLPPCVLTGQALSEGSTGPDVLCLETALVARGHLSGPADEQFDATTTAAVVLAQAAAGLDPDGIVGRNTGTALGIWPQTP